MECVTNASEYNASEYKPWPGIGNMQGINNIRDTLMMKSKCVFN